MIREGEHMKVDLAGKIVLVTGASAGIGHAIATAMAANGAIIVAVDWTTDAAETTEAISRVGGECAFFQADVSDCDQVVRAVAAAEDQFGRIDILVNNAGTNSPAELRKNINEYDVAEWHRVIGVDLDGLFYFCRAVTPGMVARGSGTIVNIASVMGLIPIRLQSAFTAAKAGVINFSRSMALELAPAGIRVNVIAPGSVLTRRTRELFYSPEKQHIAESLLSHVPLARPGNPEEIANAALFLASGDSSYVTGAVLAVDGGWTAGYAREW
jgi:NAD(P)-dependent dehydrogenase (short-subunit alcohol dehydrogenase family)